MDGFDAEMSDTPDVSTKGLPGGYGVSSNGDGMAPGEGAPGEGGYYDEPMESSGYGNSTGWGGPGMAGGPGMRGPFSGPPPRGGMPPPGYGGPPGGNRPPWGPRDGGPGGPRFMGPRGGGPPPMRGNFHGGFRGPPPFGGPGMRQDAPYGGGGGGWGGPPPGAMSNWNELPDSAPGEEAAAPANPFVHLLPPGVDVNSGDIWVETKTSESKSYFYNVKSRETVWEKPQNAVILQQEDVEKAVQAASQAAQAQQKEVASTEEAKTAAPEMEKTPSTSMASAASAVPLASAPPQNYPPYQQQPPYHHHQQQQQPPWAMGPPPGSFGVPPPMAGAMTVPPPLVGAPMGSQLPAAVGAYSASGMDESEIIKKLDPQIVARAADWTEHMSPIGQHYYYNAKTTESVWEKPASVRDFEAAKMAAIHAAKMMKENPIKEMPAYEQTQFQKEIVHEKRGDLEEKKTVEQKPAEKDEKKDKAKPVSSNPVPGTPWCVVWTGDSRVFFFNPSTRTSVWERPPELLGRGDVDRLVAQRPEPAPQTHEQQTSRGKENDDEDEESDESEEEEEPAAKKAKKDSGPPKAPSSAPAKQGGEDKPKTIDLGKQSAMEAELRAAKEREQVPLDIRMQQFKDMLAEKEVSAFSTWEKELHKIVFDPRYLLLPSKERKAVFEKYVKERADEERREKKAKLKKQRDDFRELLEESKLTAKSSFGDFSGKQQKDERYKAVEKMRERESMFNEYIQELRKKEKEETKAKREQARVDFAALLKECAAITHESGWGDVKRLLAEDPRYEAVGSSTLREEIFRDYVYRLKDEKSKEKSRKDKDEKGRDRRRSKSRERSQNRDRSSKHKSKDKDKDRHREEKDKDRSSRHKDKERKDKDKDRREKDKDHKKDRKRRHSGDEKRREDDDIEQVEKRKKDEPEDEENGYVEEDGEVDEVAREEEEREREKRFREEESLRKRELEVHRELEGHLRDRDKEREAHKRDEAIQNFVALLTDLIRGTDLSWHEAKKVLRKDKRWDQSKSLEKEEREKLYELHIQALTKKKKERFRELLDEVTTNELDLSWKDVKKRVKDDPRFTKFAASERKAEKEYKDYMKERVSNAKVEFKELLRETKLINYKSRQQLEDNPQHMKDIVEVLKNDKRYLILEPLADERDDIVRTYIEDLGAKGPPPPPTATEPSRRK